MTRADVLATCKGKWWPGAVAARGTDSGLSPPPDFIAFVALCNEAWLPVANNQQFKTNKR